MSGQEEIPQAIPTHLQMTSAFAIRLPALKQLFAFEAAQVPFAVYPLFVASVAAPQHQPAHNNSIIKLATLEIWNLLFYSPSKVKATKSWVKN